MVGGNTSGRNAAVASAPTAGRPASQRRLPQAGHPNPASRDRPPTSVQAPCLRNADRRHGTPAIALPMIMASLLGVIMAPRSVLGQMLASRDISRSRGRRHHCLMRRHPSRRQHNELDQEKPQQCHRKQDQALPVPSPGDPLLHEPHRSDWEPEAPTILRCLTPACRSIRRCRSPCNILWKPPATAGLVGRVRARSAVPTSPLGL